jgi:hypothetical protein
MDNNIIVTMEDTRRKLLENFDAEVHDRLKVSMTSSREYLDRFARMLWALTRHELGKLGKFDDAYFTFILKQAPEGLDVPPGSFYLSRHGIDGHRYRLNHPLAQHLLSMASARKLQDAEIVFDYSSWPQKAVAIEPLIGKTGTLVAHKVSVRGADDQDHVILAALTDDGARLDAKTAMRLFELPACKNAAESPAAHFTGICSNTYRNLNCGLRLTTFPPFLEWMRRFGDVSESLSFRSQFLLGNKTGG